MELERAGLDGNNGRSAERMVVKYIKKMYRKAEEIRTFRQAKNTEISGISAIWKRYFRKGGTVVSERWQKISDFPTRLTRFKCQPYNPSCAITKTLNQHRWLSVLRAALMTLF